jgi:hypothetical protein
VPHSCSTPTGRVVFCSTWKFAVYWHHLGTQALAARFQHKLAFSPSRPLHIHSTRWELRFLYKTGRVWLSIPSVPFLASRFPVRASLHTLDCSRRPSERNLIEQRARLTIVVCPAVSPSSISFARARASGCRSIARSIRHRFRTAATRQR